MFSVKKLWVIALALTLSIAPAQAALAPESIPAAFDELLKIPALSNPAMILVDGTTGQVIYEKNINSQRKPASVMKILSGAVTLKYLDPLSVFSTSISISPEEKTVVIQGSLDPWISLDHNVARKMSRASLPYLAFNTLSAVKEANGGSLKNYTVVYSNLYAKDVSNFKAFWAKRGFKPKYKAVTSDESSMAQGDTIAMEISPTVEEILKWTMLWSDNLLADRLALLSAKAAGESFNVSGVDLIFRELLNDLQIDSSKLVVKDGSGLSRQNKITAKLMGELLFKIRSDKRFTQLYTTLPISGVSGTLNTRFIKTAPVAVGLIRAKTGTLNGTATLAGYVQSGEREYIFVTLADEIPKGNSALNKARSAIDRILGRIAAPNIPAQISPAP
jgi:D-alanyl-D-alanine carboxypeptidase/D-alanyl-D-alanine-endopeptidase (penicillin-binding protein 4)